MPKIEPWMVSAGAALLLWGVWGLFSKFATQTLNPRSVLIFSTLGSMAIVAIALPFMHVKVGPLNSRGIFMAVLSGIFGTVGGLFYLYALSKGKASVAIPLTALYPAVTIILLYFFARDPVTAFEWIGIVLSFAAMVMFSL